MSCLEARIGSRITDSEMVHHLPLLGRHVEVTVHLLIVKRADAGRSSYSVPAFRVPTIRAFALAVDVLAMIR